LGRQLMILKPASLFEALLRIKPASLFEALLRRQLVSLMMIWIHELVCKL